MAEDLDVEAMLEAPFRNAKDPVSTLNGTSNHEKGRSEEDRERSRSRDKKRRSYSKEGRRRRSRTRSPSRNRRRSRSISKERFNRRARSPPRWGDRWGPRRDRFLDKSRSRSPIKPEERELPPEERDQRTVFCMQLAAKVRPRDLEEFFAAVGKVREVRLIIDNKTRRHKGIAYIEFYDINSVPLALALNGQKLCGHPIVIQPTQAEKNRAAASASATQRGISGPMRLYVGSLHFNITEEMLKGIFEPFGRIEKIELQRDPETGRSKGYGFITFYDAEDAKKALEQLNGFELAGRPMKVNHVTERSDIIIQGPSILDSDELDRTGIDLGTTGRLQLMAKLAEGTGIQLPQAAVTALQLGQVSNPVGVVQPTSAPSIATQCFMLTNMFDPSTETNPKWDEEIRNDVIEECRKHGGALHVYVDSNSQGNVYVKCPSIAAATACVTALHGRWFSGKYRSSAYVPVINYHNLFPASINATSPL
ncbi:RNA-binding protein 39-like protein [Dinothrombium tinctorium]|uniref:RNA-binding protein 39-like protein n=1 Tax=Dinothrombium tinctorium TaxID=1965070 RepID=A0A443QS80_9ACAR|nr:RNA-binding protein 39-like protein [Dinothrombium tinctorium]RWS05891.1 RNA-binding protein 39-like protein [Dinothrombium tinctorium]